MKVKNFLSIFMISVLALSAFSACSQSAEKTQKRSNEVLQKSNEPTLYTSEAFIDSSIVDSCKKISVYNYSNVEISDKEAISSICDALKNGKYEEVPAVDISKGMIKVEFSGNRNTLYLSDDLIIADEKAYRDSTKSLINAVKDYTDKYIMDSCILDSCDKIVMSGSGNNCDVTVTDKSEIAEICESIKNTEFTFFDLGYGMGRDGGIYVEFFYNGFSQGFQPGEEIYVNRLGFRADNTEFRDIIFKYYDKYRENQ